MSNDLQPKGSQLQPGHSVLDVMTPGNYADWWRLAGNLSESGILPNALNGKAGAVLSIIARGAFLGIPWPIAVQEAYVVQGHVCWPAAILASIVATSPEFEFFEILEADDEHAVVEAKKHRWDKPRQYAVDMGDAKRAGYLDGKHSEQWRLRPRFMLIAMARREAARMWDPVRCAGLYTLEELETARAPRDYQMSASLLEPADLIPADSMILEPGSNTEAAKGVVSPDPVGPSIEPAGSVASYVGQLSDLQALADQASAAGVYPAMVEKYGLPKTWELNRAAIEAAIEK